MWVASGIALLVKPCMLPMKITMIQTTLFNAIISWTVKISIHFLGNRAAKNAINPSILWTVELHINVVS
jgi:hypothetical protein